jgi:hypothetical protein
MVAHRMRGTFKRTETAYGNDEIRRYYGKPWRNI